VGSGAWPNEVFAMRMITTFCQVFKIENCSLDFFVSFFINGKKKALRFFHFASSYAEASVDESLRNRRFEKVNDKREQREENRDK
jgi:hypothetical protein